MSVYYVRNLSTNSDLQWSIVGFSEASDEKRRNVVQLWITAGLIKPVYRYKIYSVIEGDLHFILEYCVKCKTMALTCYDYVTDRALLHH